MPTLYDTTDWRRYSSRVRAEHDECALAHLAGNCRGDLQLHHIDPLSEGGAEFPGEDGLVVLCQAHHAWVHAWRRRKQPKWKRCPHHHRSRESREQCERKLNHVAA